MFRSICCAIIPLLMLACTGCATATVATPVPPATRVLGQAAVYISAGGERLEIVHDVAAGIAIVKLPDGALALLPAEIAGTEGRYRDNSMTVWENEGGALLWVNGKLVFSGRSGE